MFWNKKSLLLIFLANICIFLYSQNIDVRLLREIHAPHITQVDGAFKFISNTTTVVSLGVSVCYLVYGKIKSDHSATENAIFIGSSQAIDGLITLALKYSIKRPRPFTSYPEYFYPKSDDGSPSMPSGHTSLAFATATALSIQNPRWYVILPSFLWASSVAYSRMHLGVHYPSDVLMGIAIGSASAYLSYKANQWLKKKYRY